MTVTFHTRRSAVIVAAAASTIALVVHAGPADAATKLHCTATASPSRPTQHSTVHINVNGNKAGARIATVAHYKSTTTAHSATANRNGNASIAYLISSATKGYQVKVGVTLTSGKSRTSCATSFTPR